jgi:FAD/FMN-containing dehydrogenase
MHAELARIVGAAHVLTGADAAPFLTDWRKRFTGRAQAVVRPADAAQVAQIVQLCAATRTPIVPQGGNTGLVGGATPDDSGKAVVIHLGRLQRIRSIDPLNNTPPSAAICPPTLAARRCCGMATRGNCAWGLKS